MKQVNKCLLYIFRQAVTLLPCCSTGIKSGRLALKGVRELTYLNLHHYSINVI